MSPGFDEADYEHADDVGELIAEYPDCKSQIEALTGQLKYA